MRKIFKVLACACVIVCAYACTKQDINNNLNQEPEPKVPAYTLTHSIDFTIADLIAHGLIVRDEEDESYMVASWLKSMAEKQGWGKVRAYDYTYPSTDRDGSPITLSSRVYVPHSAFTDTSNVRGKILVNHFTQGRNDFRPSKFITPESWIAWRNYICVTPDYYGLGASVDKPQGFMDGPFTAKGNIDAYIAADSLLADLGIKYADFHANIGYSQGATMTMAALRHTALHPECGVHFDKTVAGGGVYDVAQSYREYITGDDWTEASNCVLLTTTYLLEYENLTVKPEDVFVEPMLSGREEWILSKNHSIFEFADQLDTLTYKDLLTQDAQTLGTATSDALIAALDKYNLIRGWDIPQGSELYLLHSTEDDYVPYKNYELFVDEFGPKTSVDQFHPYSSDGGGHIIYFLYFIGKMAEIFE